MRPSGTSVSDVGRGLGILRGRGALESGQDALGAAVAGFVKEDAVSAGGVDGFQQVEVRVELDLAVLVPGSEREVDHHPVCRELGIEGEVHLPHELLVGAREPETAALEKNLAAIDAKAHDAGFDDCGREAEREYDRGAKAGH